MTNSKDDGSDGNTSGIITIDSITYFLKALPRAFLVMKNKYQFTSGCTPEEITQLMLKWPRILHWIIDLTDRV